MTSDNHPRIVPGGNNTQVPPASSEKIGILGAGIGGLYAALILDSLDIDYEVLEASDRIGGRVSTYKFQGGGKYDYYDSGPMRFPFPNRNSLGQYNNGIMKRLAELTEYGPLNQGQDRLRDSVIPYYYLMRHGANPSFYYYNGIREPTSNPHKGPFGAQEMGIDADYIRVGADAINDDVVRPFVQGLLRDIETGGKDGWEMLLDHDSYTLESYMATKYIPSPYLGLPPQHLPSNVINWCGLLGRDSVSGLVDHVLLLASIIKSGTTEWKCFEGGTQMLIKKVGEHLHQRGSSIHLSKRVTAISQDHTIIEIPTGTRDHSLPSDAQELSEDPTRSNRRRVRITSVSVTVNGCEKHNYSHVISTLPLPVLRTVDLNNAGLNILQRNAVRSFKLTGCTKVAILFKSNWWTTKLGIVGGQTRTDLPIGLVVYPSYGVDSNTPSKVLIASFSYGVNACDLASLAQHREALRELILHNLAEVHSGLHPEVTYEYLQDEFVDMHVKDWDRDGYAMGAMVTFKVGEFKNLYPALTMPAAGKRLHFAGEAISLRHGWIVGALESSWRVIHGYLESTGQEEKMKKFKSLWGENSEWFVKTDN